MIICLVAYSNSNSNPYTTVFFIITREYSKVHSCGICKVTMLTCVSHAYVWAHGHHGLISHCAHVQLVVSHVVVPLNLFLLISNGFFRRLKVNIELRYIWDGRLSKTKADSYLLIEAPRLRSKDLEWIHKVHKMAENETAQRAKKNRRLEGPQRCPAYWCSRIWCHTFKSCHSGWVSSRSKS